MQIFCMQIIFKCMHSARPVDAKYALRLSERRVPLNSGPLTPSLPHCHVIRGVSGGSQLSPMMPRGTTLSDSCKHTRCRSPGIHPLHTERNRILNSGLLTGSLSEMIVLFIMRLWNSPWGNCHFNALCPLVLGIHDFVFFN